jgi:signal transduction histidine kinase
MHLRTRLLLFGTAIVVVSLVFSGLLSWYLVVNLESASAHVELDREVLAVHQDVLKQQCESGSGTGTCPNPTKYPNPYSCPDRERPACDALATPDEYEARLRDLARQLTGDRLLLLNADRRVVFDSGEPAALGAEVPLPRQRSQGVFEGDFMFNNRSYLVAGLALSVRRDPLRANHVVLARPTSQLAAVATSELLPDLAIPGLAGFLLALAVSIALARTVTGPLAALGAAAEDIASGNYSRRVTYTAKDEVGVLGQAFNRMAEAVERTRKLQRDFLANVSHELKTPLTSLIGFSQALVDGSLHTEAERNRAATILNEEAHRVLRMAQELLDMARVESGQMSLRVQPVDLGWLLEQEIDIVRRRAEERNLVLALTVPPDLPPVQADPERLHQILDNLLDNAVKYAPAGSTVRVGADIEEGLVVAHVINPVGSHPPDPEHMFDRFYRADPSRSSAGAGVGLGLSIAKELASAHRGRLWAEIDPRGNLHVRLAVPPMGASPKEKSSTQKLKALAGLAPREEDEAEVRPPAGRAS